MSNVAINIAAEFKGKPAFKKAETSVDRLEKRTRNLGKTLTASFGTAAIVAFGKASVKAFAEDDKAATALGTTLKNLNLAYGSNIGTVNGYISRLEMQTGVLDDELRPAMDRFLRATGDVAKAQDLLNLSLDVAAGTGKSVAQVSQSLQKAYLGQTQAIGRLGVGLTRAELTSSSFEEIQQRLTTLFAGQAQAAAETFAGELDKLTIAANNAKETIGKGLYDAITSLSGGGATAATDNIDKLSKGVADTLANVGELIGRLEKLKPILIAFGIAAAAAFLPVTTAIAGAIFLLGDLNKRLNEQSFRKGIIPGGMGNVSMTVSSQDTQRADRVAAKAAQEQVKATKALTKLTKDQVKLAKAKAIFDIQRIQIEAALKGKISEEERIRLFLLRAIMDENIEDIEKYTKMLNLVQSKVEELQDILEETYAMDAGNPFIEWEIGLDGVQRALIQIEEQSIQLTSTLAQNSLAMGLLGGASFAQALSGARYAAQAAASMGITGTIGSLPPLTGGTGPAGAGGNTVVNVVVQGTVTTEQEFKQSIIDAVNQSGLTGNQLITGVPERQVAI